MQFPQSLLSSMIEERGNIKMKFTSAKPVILASASPRRKEILSLLGFPFTVVPSNVPEDIEMWKMMILKLMHESLPRGKRWQLPSDDADHIVIGADTIVVHEGKLYPKPTSKEQAKAFLKELSGKTHTVITGVGLCIGWNVAYIFR